MIAQTPCNWSIGVPTTAIGTPCSAGARLLHGLMIHTKKYKLSSLIFFSSIIF